jgi:type VI secretion system protein ImpJ
VDQKLIWSEGMFLAPQHFQQWDRYHEGLLQRRVSQLRHLAWGVSNLALNEEGLAIGEMAVLRFQGVLPDGLVVDCPGHDAPPPSRSVGQHFGPDRERLGVFLAAPMIAPGFPEYSPAGIHDGRPTRYRASQIEISDAVAGGSGREVAVAAKNLRLIFEGESLQDHSWLKIAELGRAGTGGFTLAESYAPPCLRVSASGRLMDHLRRMLEILIAKSSEFAKLRRSRGAGLASFSTAESASFWLLHTVNGAIPPLQHAFAGGAAHPEEVYLELARLCGFLYTFSSEGHPRDVPPYSHEDLAGTYGRLAERISALLDTIIPTKCTPIPMQKTRENMFVAQIQDDRVLAAEGALYLAVLAEVPAEKVAREAPLKIKISSSDRVDQLITAALRGLGVKHLPAPPPEIPVQPGRQYFQVDKAGDHWEAVRSSRSMAFYLPPEFTGLRLELMAVKD